MTLWFSGCATAWHDVAGTLGLALLTQPVSQTVPAEQNATFSVVAQGGEGVTYQWYANGVAVAGPQHASYTVKNAAMTQTGERLSVVVSDGKESITSSTAILTVTPLNPNLAFAPLAPLAYGSAPTFISASTSSPAPISYQVRSGPATIAGQMVTFTAPGAVVLEADQPVSGDYSAGSATTFLSVAQNVNVTQIYPPNQTMAPGTQVYTASVTGGTTDDVTWASSGGSFSGSVWTSPNVAGTYAITAKSKDDPTQSLSTNATISAPVITQQPVNLVGCLTPSSMLNVEANYAQSYQWQRNGVPIPGATRSSYVVGTNVTNNTGDVYQVTVSNPAGSVTSTTASTPVLASIVKNPTSVSVVSPQSASFTVGFQGLSPFTYQWFSESSGSTAAVAIQGATSATLLLSSTSQADSGKQFYVRVTDSCGTAMISLPATLLVSPEEAAPVIDVQPTNLTLVSGASGRFYVHATGSATLNYQWYRISAGLAVGTAIPNATSPAYTVPPSSTNVSDDQDSYYATITNAFGTAASVHALLTIGDGITITKQPSNAYVDAGTAGTFSVIATSLLPLTYQWFTSAPGSSQFTPVPGATGASLTTGLADKTQNGAAYYVVVSNSVTTSVQSSTADLFVDQLQGITPCDWMTHGSAIANGCNYQLTDALMGEAGTIVWPHLLSTENLELSFTVTLSDTSPIPADGFAVVFGDPALGAKLDSQGSFGLGLGAMGIPGVVVAFDDYYNYANGLPGFAGDPQVPYIGVTRGESNLFETPYYMENSAIPALAAYGQSISHNYVISILSGLVKVTMDGVQVISGSINMPSAAYLYVTAGTGACWERTVVSNLQAVTMPSHP